MENSIVLDLYPRFVDEFLNTNLETASLFNEIISSGSKIVDGDILVNEHFNPMVEWIYDRIEESVNARSLNVEQVKLFVGELSVFARYNSTFLLRAADTIRPFCSELAQELTRNYLEEGGERGKLPAHYVIFSGALIKDLNFRVNGWMPRARSTQTLLSMIDILSWSHCPSTILGMYYATEAVATRETEQIRKLTDQFGTLLNFGISKEMPNLDFYYDMHLDHEHEAASDGVAVETGHQEGIAHFIDNSDMFNFLQPQIVDGFLQMLYPFVDQWAEMSYLVRLKQ